MAKKLINVECTRCGIRFDRHTETKYIREDGSVTCGVYCASCRQISGKMLKGRKTVDIMADRTPEQFGVKIFSQAEIDAIAGTLTIPKKVKRKREILPAFS